MPHPDRRREVLETDNTIDKTIGFCRIVRRAEFEDELVLFAKIDLLQMPALGEIPEMQAAAVFAAKQDLGNETIFECVGGAPLTGHHRVIAEMPPPVITEKLRSTVDFPTAERLEAFVVHQEDPAGRLSLGVAARRHLNSAGSAD